MTNLLAVFAGAMALALGPAGVVQAEPPDWDSISEKIVRHALGVKPGETVIITGGPTQIELLGALQVATANAGGLPTVQLDIPEANKRSLMETPIEYLAQPPLYKIHQMRNSDSFIDVRSVQEPGIYAEVPEERLAAFRRWDDLSERVFKRAHFRRVTLGQIGGIPSVAYAKSQGANYQDMIAMFWNALDVNYDQLMKSGKIVSTKLQPGSQLHLETSNGTDLTFEVGRSRPRLNTGRIADNLPGSGVAQVWLPAGEAYACTEPTSAEWHTCDS